MGWKVLEHTWMDMYFVDAHTSLDDLVRRGGGGVLLSDGDKMPSYYCLR
jgi:hypothetical protein